MVWKLISQLFSWLNDYWHNFERHLLSTFFVNEFFKNDNTTPCERIFRRSLYQNIKKLIFSYFSRFGWFYMYGSIRHKMTIDAKFWKFKLIGSEKLPSMKKFSKLDCLISSHWSGSETFGIMQIKKWVLQSIYAAWWNFKIAKYVHVYHDFQKFFHRGC